MQLPSKPTGLFCLSVALTAFATNPSEESFKVFVDKAMRREGFGWIQRQVVASMANGLISRRNFLFFSFVTLGDGEGYFVGLFNTWLILPFLGRRTDAA